MKVSKRSKMYGRFHEAIAWYEQGLTLYEIADIFNMCASSVWETFRNHGVRTRNPSEATRLAYEKGRRRAHVMRGSANPSWKGGRTKRISGYILVLKPDHPRADNRGYVPEHTVVAEKVLGRMLHKNEVAHHINGCPDDNRPENLHVMKDTEHKRLHAKRRYKKNGN
jgi:hypothetical protein